MIIRNQIYLQLYNIKQSFGLLVVTHNLPKVYSEKTIGSRKEGNIFLALIENWSNTERALKQVELSGTQAKGKRFLNQLIEYQNSQEEKFQELPYFKLTHKVFLGLKSNYQNKQINCMKNRINKQDQQTPVCKNQQQVRIGIHIETKQDQRFIDFYTFKIAKFYSHKYIKA